MVHSIDSTSLVGSSVTPASAGILQSQLRRYETQLADSCDCPSAKTQAGKQKIADLQAKADATRARLQQVEAARSPGKTDESTATKDPRSAPGQAVASRLVDIVV